MPSLRTVLHCSSRKSLFDTFIYWLVLLKSKANEASDKDILDTNVEMLCQVWGENQCSSTSRPLSGSSASKFYEPSIWSEMHVHATLNGELWRAHVLKIHFLKSSQVDSVHEAGSNRKDARQLSAG